MSQKTIQCCLVATEASRRNIWQLTAESNTPLINELLSQIAKDARFEGWCRKGNVPQQTVKDEFCNPLRSEPQFEGQPGRFYTSAIVTVSRIFKSWIRIRRSLIYRLEGQTRWLLILQSDEELIKACKCDLEILRATAAEIFSRTTSQSSKTQKSKSGKNQEQKKPQEDKSKFNTLFELYKETDDNLTRGAIAYLLKNGGKPPDKPEDPKKFIKRRRKAEIRVERLTNTLKRMRLPSGRDLTDQKWLKTLATAASSVPEDEDEAVLWQAILLSGTSKIPFPVTYETNEDLTWFLNDKGRLCVSFNGLSDHTFEIYCGKEQLHLFKRFLEDQLECCVFILRRENNYGQSLYPSLSHHFLLFSKQVTENLRRRLSLL